MVIKRAATVFDQAARTRVVGRSPVCTPSAGSTCFRAAGGAGGGGGAAVLAVYIWIAQADAPGGDWRAVSVAWACAALLAALAGGFVVGLFISSRMPWLRRRLVGRAAMAVQVEAAAAAAFYDNRVRDTADATGVLIYLSLHERTAVILADRTALKARGPPAVNQLCADLVARLRAGDLADALCATIAAIGDALAEPLPRRADDVNELPDCLVLVD